MKRGIKRGQSMAQAPKCKLCGAANWPARGCSQDVINTALEKLEGKAKGVTKGVTKVSVGVTKVPASVTKVPGGVTKVPSFVTGVTKARPRCYESNAERQRAYRGRRGS